jgi:hypothetical protein
MKPKLIISLLFFRSRVKFSIHSRYFAKSVPSTTVYVDHRSMFFVLSGSLWKSWSQSYQTLISSFIIFSLLSLSVCGIRKYCLCFEMDKLNSKNGKKSSFYEEKSLVGLTPGCKISLLFYFKSEVLNVYKSLLVCDARQTVYFNDLFGVSAYFSPALMKTYLHFQSLIEREKNISKVIIFFLLGFLQGIVHKRCHAVTMIPFPSDLCTNTLFCNNSVI